MGVPLLVKVVKVTELKPFWIRIHYRYETDMQRPGVNLDRAKTVLKDQMLTGVYSAFAFRQGKEWKIDFLAGKD